MKEHDIDIFAKYAFTGKYDEAQTKNILNKKFELYSDVASDDDVRAIERQYYLYSKCKENHSVAEAIEKYLKYLINEIEHQYTRKYQMETRAGLLLALWGVMTIPLIESGIEFGNDLCSKFMVSTLIISCLVSIISLMFIVLSKQMIFYNFKSEWFDLHAIVEDNYMQTIRFMEGYRNSFKSNELVLSKIGKTLNLAVISETVYLIFEIIYVARCGGTK